MEIKCQQCGATLGGEIGAGLSGRCPLCRAELGKARAAGASDRIEEQGIATRVLPDREEAPDDAGGNDLSTMFQPGMMVDAAAEDEALGETDWWGFKRPPSAGAPPLELDVEPYLVAPGAPPGTGRIVLKSARTTFGRAQADVILADATVSAPHFQVDVVGKEFFVRDLDSTGGTQLNGHRITHSELLPGDQLRAGETTLVFRTSGDGLAA